MLRLARLLAVLAFVGCKSVQTTERATVARVDAPTLDKRSPFLKAHLRDGHVLILSAWSIDTSRSLVAGTGSRLDVNRQPAVGSPVGTQAIALDSVALFETNVVKPHPSIAAMAVITGASVALTAFCAMNTKACFGSCPTFYVSDGEHDVLQAEGFSASVAPSLEATDIDALYRARPTSRTLTIRMTNEALETHVVRWATVLAAPRPTGGRVFATQSGEFWQASEVAAPVRCTAAEGDCLASVRAADGVERYSRTDSTDLAARETIELEFPAMADGPTGVVLASRQTLLSTFVLYQGLAYMGRSAGRWLAALQRGDAQTRRQMSGVGRVLGAIEVQVPDSGGGWVTVGETQETGPLATDLRVVPLPRAVGAPRRVRLRLTRGHWRIDGVTLARLTGRVEPVRIEPREVRRRGKADAEALALLTDPSRSLTTMPGDEYTLVYRLPEHPQRYELFLESRGYYLEWMREEWMAEENPTRAAMLLLDPAGAMKLLAPEFKRREAEMETAFWGSRYVRR